MWIFLQSLRHGWTPPSVTVKFFLTLHQSALCVKIEIVMVMELLFLISPRVKYVVRDDLSMGNIETVWIEIFPTSKRAMLLCCVYHPPSQYTFFNNFLSEYETAQLQCPRLLVLGDVNVNLLNPSCSLTKLFLSIMRQVQLIDIVGEPTRITINTSQIDDILTTALTQQGCILLVEVIII